MNDAPSRFAAFLAELRRRRVFRVAIVYAGVAFIVFQIIDATFDYLPIPGWVGTTLIVVLLLGFPIAVALAWAFDITDKGIVRTRGKAQAPATSRRPILTNWTLGIVAALAVIVAAWALLREPSPGGAAISSIAVLPLENLMGDPEQEYFVDGMHEALTVELSKISALRVIGRTSTMSYKANPKPIPEIAEELDVDAMIEGSVMRVGDMVRITVQLVATRPERHLWVNNYERSMKKILALQKDVATAIAEEIKITLTPEEAGRLTISETVNPKAHLAYLKGRHHRRKDSVEGTKKALEYFNEAIAIDQTYALAYAGLAETYRGATGWLYSNLETGPKAQAALKLATKHGPDYAEVHTALANYKVEFEWDWRGAEQEYLASSEIDKMNGLSSFASFLSLMGQHDEALQKANQALQSDPLSVSTITTVAANYFRARQWHRAEELCNNALELEQDDLIAHLILANIYVANGYPKKAVKEFQILRAIEDGSDFMGYHGHAYGMAGDSVQAKALLGSLMEFIDTGNQNNLHTSPLHIVWVYIGLGQLEAAIDWLDKAYALRSNILCRIKVDPMYDPLRSHPRFQELLAKMNFPE